MDIYQKTKQFYHSWRGEKTVVGESVLGRELYAVKIGQGNPVGLVQYAIHGREFITTELAFLHAKVGVPFGSLWILPLLNPDGALLSQTGLQSVFSQERKAFLLSICKGKDFSLWKANANGVDLNVNFAARWGKGAKNIAYPYAENHIGQRPFSEPESFALKQFTQKVGANYMVSYHTKGEEIYWYFYQPMRDIPRDKGLAVALSRSTGYPLAMAGGSAGGYKDWCIAKLGIPAFTIEAGADAFTHPIREEGLENILTKNKNALFDLSKAYQEYLVRR